MSTYTATDRARAQRNKLIVSKVQAALWMRSKTRAKQMGMDHDIGLDYIIEIWPVDSTCPVFKNNMMVEEKINRPSLDRIDATRGYVKGNIAVISWKANSLKSTGSHQEFKAVLEYMHRLGAT